MERLSDLIAPSDLIVVFDPADRGRAAAGPAHQALSRSARRDGW
ncbi:hypothetical protein [Actinacidiphila glaucinigra]